MSVYRVLEVGARFIIINGTLMYIIGFLLNYKIPLLIKRVLQDSSFDVI